MDLLGIARTVLRHRILSAVIVLATIIGAAGYWTVAPQQWQATSSFALISPTAPTDSQIARDPALGRLNSNNPYLGLGDITTVTSVLSAVMTTTSVQDAIVKDGGSPQYTVAPSNEYSSAGKLIQVTATAGTPTAAGTSIKIVDRVLVAVLRQQQKTQGADDRFLITAFAIGQPSLPTEVISGKLRSVIVLVVAGMIVLFVALSIAEAIRTRRRQRTDPQAAAQVPDTAAAAAAAAAVAAAAGQPTPAQPAPDAEPTAFPGWSTPAPIRPELVPAPAGADLMSELADAEGQEAATPAVAPATKRGTPERRGAARTPTAEDAAQAKPARRPESASPVRARRGGRGRTVARAEPTNGPQPADKARARDVAWADEGRAQNRARSGS